MKLLSAISPVTNWRQLRQDGESATIERLMTSRHVADLRLIFSSTVLIVVVSIGLALLFSYAHERADPHNADATWSFLLFAALVDCREFIGAVGAIGCGVLAWTYQTGSARLGVVDLFACEIATLCRVTVVAETVDHFTRLGKSIPDSIPHFSSQESYFPIFDATTKDLQQLEEEVVKNVTAFYTYMKVARDHMRKLADIDANSADALAKWQAAVGNVVYMLFLALESARKSMQDLVEFQPTQAEETITILLSELGAYAYLRTIIKDDLRQRRLAARDAHYRLVVPKLLATVRNASGEDWDTSKELAIELEKRYDQIFPVARDGPGSDPIGSGELHECDNRRTPRLSAPACERELAPEAA